MSRPKRLLSRVLVLSLALGVGLGCAAEPERTAAGAAATRLSAALRQRGVVPETTTVALRGVRRVGEDDDAARDDPVARLLRTELEAALLRETNVVSHEQAEEALRILSLQGTELFAKGEQQRLGEWLEADVFVTAEYVPDEKGRFELVLVARSVHTLESLASARAPSRSPPRRVWDGTVTTAAWVTSPLPVVWDMLAFSADRSFGAEDMSFWRAVGGIVLFPVFFVASPFIAPFDETRWWLDRPRRAPEQTEAVASG